MNFTLIIQKNDETIHRSWTIKKRRIIKSLRGIKWQHGGITATLRIRYGTARDCYGELVVFANEGTYSDDESMWKAFEAFTEKGVY